MGVTASDLDGWAEEFAAFHARFAPYFLRSEVRARCAAYLRALLSGVERKNGWQLAEAIGETDPNGTQRLLYQAIWNEDAVRDELQAFVAEQFGDPEGIFVVDETEFLKKGERSVGVQRQYELPEPPGRRQLEEIGEVWRPYRTIATWYMWKSLGFVPQSDG